MGSGRIYVEPHDRGRWRIVSTYFSDALRQAAWEVPGMSFIYTPVKCYVGYPDAIEITLKLLREKGVKVNAERFDPESLLARVASETEPQIPVARTGRRSYQNLGVNFLISEGESGALLADAPRLGKAQPIDEPVLTPQGWRLIGELRVGDEVVGSSGTPVRVTGIFPQGRKKIYRVTMTDGAWTRCTLDHLWAVKTADDRKRKRELNRVLSLKELVEIGLRKGGSNRRWFVPMTGCVEFKAADLPIDPYLLGALIANGCFMGHTPAHSGGEDQVEQVAHLLPEGVFVSRWTTNDVGLSSGPPLQQTNPLKVIIKKLGLDKLYSHEKFVPKQFLYSAKEQRISIVQGLFDNDGTVSKDGLTTEYNTTSPQLAADVLFLIRSLGGSAWVSTRIPTYTHKGKKLKGKKDYRIRVSLPPDVIPFRIERKRDRFKPRTKFLPAHAIDTVEPCGSSLCICISVSANDGLYLTRDCIVTHNTNQALTAARAFQAPTLVVCPSHVVGVWARSNPAAKRQCEVERWWPEAYKKEVLTLEGTRPGEEDREKISKWVLEGGLVVVIHYDILYAWADVLISIFDFKTLIVDEVHAWQTQTSRRSQAGEKLCLHAKRVYALSGTPMTNRPRDLFSVCNLISQGRFGDNFWRFGKRYCAGHEKTVGKGEGQKTVWDFDGSSNEEELKRRLSFFMLRRTKAEVAEQLPPETRQVIELTVPRKFSLPSLPSLQSPAAARKALELAADGALPQVVQMLEEDHREGTKQVVFTFRRSVAEFLYQELQERNIPSELIHGLVPTRKREARIQTARDAETSHTLVATIDSCSTGIDLSYASTATYVELPWEIVDLLQSKERLYNYDQFTPIAIKLLCVKGTASELHLSVLLAKLAVQEAVIGKIGDDKLKLDLQGYQSGEDSLKQLCQEMMAEAERRGGKEKGKKGRKS